MEFTNKTAIVTGAGRGIGKAVALAFASEGANVVAADIDEQTAKDTANQIRKMGRGNLFVRVDVSKIAEVTKMVDEALRSSGQIDVLVNAAAIDMSGKLVKDTTEEDWDKIMNVNLKGTFNCCKAVISYMERQNSGKIINFSSCVARTGCVRDSHYAASKAGVTNLTKSLAAELALSGINVNAVSPGSIRTKLIEPLLAKPGVEEWISNKIAQKRIGVPEDVVGVVLFLASSAADYITGQDIPVDGGIGVGF